jgi:transcriptional regulator with XRE-family HTH domain
MTDDEQDLAKAILLLRVAADWDQKDLAAALGVSKSWISQIECAQSPPNWSILQRVPKVLGVSFPLLRQAQAVARGVRERSLGLSAAAGTEIALPELAAAHLVRSLGAGSALPHAATPAEARRHAVHLWHRMRRLPHGLRLTLVEKLPEFQSWALCERLCEESARQAAHCVTRAGQLAALALAVAARVPGGDAWRLRLQGYGNGFVANVQRVANDFMVADATFARSAELWHQGASGDPGGLLDGVRLLDLEASLRREQRRLPEALALIDRALACRAGGEGRARLLLKRAKTLEELGDYPAAVTTLREAAPLLGADAEPRLVCALHLNLTDYLVQLGEVAEAEILLPGARSLAARLGNDLDLLRSRWIEGRVAAARGREAEAASTFDSVRRDFAARGLPYDAALCTIELAALLLEQGRTGDVKELARESAPIFTAKGVHREAQAALELFRRAAEQESVTAVLAHSLAAYLANARHDVMLAFEWRA